MIPLTIVVTLLTAPFLQRLFYAARDFILSFAEKSPLARLIKK